MEEQSGSLIRRTRFFHSVYHRFEASRSEYSIPFTLQPRRIPGSNPSSPDSVTINSKRRPTHVTHQQTVSPISVLEDSEDFCDAGGSIRTRGLETPHSQRKERKKGFFGKLVRKHSHNIKTTTTLSSSDSKSLSRVSTFLKHVKPLIFRMPKIPAMEPRRISSRKCCIGFRN